MRIALALAALLASAPGPPVIHEPFTPLPCPAHPSTTLALEGCAERALLASDRAIDARVAKAYRLLATTSGQAAFVAGERSWLAYRRATCAAAGAWYAGGSAEPVVVADCEQARNVTHLRDLAALLRGLVR